MMKLTLDLETVDKILDIYEKKDITKKTRGRRPKSIVTSLRESMEAQIGISLSDSDRIVQKFLNDVVDVQGGNQATENEARIRKYLSDPALTQIIEKFWECVTHVWIAKIADPSNSDVSDEQKKWVKDISNNSGVKAEIARSLSKWNGHHHALECLFKNWTGAQEERDRAYLLIRDTVTLESLPFFCVPGAEKLTPEDANAAGELEQILRNQIDSGKNFAQRMLRYHDSVFPTQDRKTSAMDILSNIFNYDLLKDDIRHKVLSKLYIPVCPYCNRQYITKYNRINTTRTTADLDHFYYKKIYPYLALSVYNFVPSCQVCNSRIKHEADFYAPPHLYPYAQPSNSVLKFKLADPSLIWRISQWKDPDLENTLVIDIVPGKDAVDDEEQPNSCKKAERSIESLYLKEIYQTHKDYVQELMCKVLAYNSAMTQGIYDDFTIEIVKNGKKTSIQLFENTDQIREMVFGQRMQEENLHTRPLAKLTYDLLKELQHELEQHK